MISGKSPKANTNINKLEIILLLLSKVISLTFFTVYQKNSATKKKIQSKSLFN